MSEISVAEYTIVHPRRPLLQYVTALTFLSRNQVERADCLYRAVIRNGLRLTDWIRVRVENSL